MRTPARGTKPRAATLASFPVPTGGLVSNVNIATPPQGGAEVLRNWFPTTNAIRLRRGMRRWATLTESGTVRSLFTYTSGLQHQLFAASDVGIWDVTNVPAPFDSMISANGIDNAISPGPNTAFGARSVDGPSVTPWATNGDWITLQFSTAGGTFLIGVNGIDEAFIYDGLEFWPYISGGVSSLGVSGAIGDFEPGDTVIGDVSGATGVVVREAAGFLYLRDIAGTFQVGELVEGAISGLAEIDQAVGIAAPGLDGIASDRISYVWSYKNRVWFIERDTLNTWYLPVDQVGGMADVFPLGGIFPRGGSLLWGQSWSLDSSGDGGLSAQNVFVTTEGEVASYQGLSPEDAASWSIVGVYQIGRPLGKKAWIRAGGDLIIATTLGMIPLGRAIQTDYAGLGMIAISNPISDQWVSAVDIRGSENWVCHLWGEGQMMLVAPPVPTDAEPLVLVSNSDSGAWCEFTTWEPTAITTFRGGLFMGGPNGRVQQGWIGGSDEGMPYTGVCVPLFNDLGSPGQLKVAKVARAVMRSTYEVRESIVAMFDWRISMPPAPNTAPIPNDGVWDSGIWDVSVWNADRNAIVSNRWSSVGGSGYASSVVLQVTSGASVPLDVEVVRFDYSYTTADIVT